MHRRLPGALVLPTILFTCAALLAAQDEPTPPAVLELGNTGGFDMMLQNRGGLPR